MLTDASINIHAIYEFDIIDKKKIQKYMYFLCITTVVIHKKYMYFFFLTQLGEIIVRHRRNTSTITYQLARLRCISVGGADIWYQRTTGRLNGNEGPGVVY